MYTLYPGIANSPQTTLSEAYVAGDNHLHLTELSAAPAANNIIVVGTDETSVTFAYTGKSAASGTGTLTGVSVVEGTDKNWDLGTKVSRNFTNYEWDRNRLNVEELDTARIKYSEVTGTTQAAAVNTAYICNNTARVTVTLPATAAIGTVVEVIGKGAGGWKVAQNSGQSIQFANVTSTTGTAGYLQSMGQFDQVRLVCTTANTVFEVVSSVGTMEVV